MKRNKVVRRILAEKGGGTVSGRGGIRWIGAERRRVNRKGCNKGNNTGEEKIGRNKEQGLWWVG